MAEMLIILRRDPQTGKQNIVVKLDSDPDALPVEHEQMHKKLVEKINGNSNKLWEELGPLVDNPKDLPVELSGGDKSKVARLDKAEGEKFDKELLELIEKEAKQAAKELFAAPSPPVPMQRRLRRTLRSTSCGMRRNRRRWRKLPREFECLATIEGEVFTAQKAAEQIRALANYTTPKTESQNLVASRG